KPPSGSMSPLLATPEAIAPHSGSELRNVTPIPQKSLWQSYFLLLSRGNLRRQPLQLFRLQQLVVHQSHQQLFQGPFTKPINKLLNRSCRNVALGVHGSVHKSPSVNCMVDVALLFQLSQDRADRRVLKGSPRCQSFPACLGCAARVFPYVLHKKLFESS